MAPVPSLHMLHIWKNVAGVLSPHKYARRPPHLQAAPFHHFSCLFQFIQVQQRHHSYQLPDIQLQTLWVCWCVSDGLRFVQLEKLSARVIVAILHVCSVQLGGKHAQDCRLLCNVINTGKH